MQPILLLYLVISCIISGSRGEGFSYASCKATVLNGTFGTQGTTDRYGVLTTNLSLVEGYQYQYCVQNCGGGVEFNNYKAFSEQSTIWFLPWFLLLAQIPYFTQNKFSDFIVMLLSIGSPTTALYSLFLSILDRSWLKSYCNNILPQNTAGELGNDIFEVLSSLRQFPVEVLDVGLLASTFEDRKWWPKLRSWFVGRRRRMEASAYAQLLLTVVVYCFSVLPEAFSNLGDNTTAHGLAIGNLWMWLIPLVWGWFAVGTHHGRREPVVERLHESVGDIVLATEEEAYEAEDGIITICDHRKDIKWIPTKFPRFDGDLKKERQSIFCLSIAGDELADGPFYNYARCSTWSNVCKKIVLAYFDVYSPLKHSPPSAAANIRERVTDAVRGIQSSQPSRGFEFSRLSKESNIVQNGPLKRFAWKESIRSNTECRYRKILAFAVAFVLQGVFGWSAFMIDYTTPTIGIGCRAFICMMYSLISVSSCVLLIAASHFADSWSFQLERYLWSLETHPGLPKSRDMEPNITLAMAAVGFRLLGKVLAILNAFFIVLGCILEFAGVYESCFCKSSHIGLGSRAFISFLSTEESVQIARPYWYGGAGAAMLTVLMVCFGYFTKVHHQFKIVRN